MWGLLLLLVSLMLLLLLLLLLLWPLGMCAWCLVLCKRHCKLYALLPELYILEQVLQSKQGEGSSIDALRHWP